ncbi:gliding motility protein RemB [Sphingobacterium sp. DK4209]|uniref:Gliding motility protein RemB n=1 Tax=Sphingobacterium zhuxiongii TaxID=2662364 RepID=A0A5Q0Q898_9SPHI|nr:MULTISPECIES: gliding motility protein RemB [unclassified Sphingobacterium]MVZ64366.1 gliding motility protein RemB [Sphingobacterium sp. DK4209]QGA25713.1 gliding motility protein RemB [Sphingobacterium sp. dk4302]
MKHIINGALATVLLIGTADSLQAQIKNQPFSHQQYQKLNEEMYSPYTRYHTSSKPVLFKGALLEKLDSIETANQTMSDNWIMRKLFNEHLIEVEKEDHTFYLDVLPDFQIGSELMGADKRTTWLNTRGVQAGLTIKDKFTFYGNFFENQGVFPSYIDDYVSRNMLVPGQAASKKPTEKEKDWMYATANLTYDFSDYFQATLAYDKNFIGDGYRSVLLSDFSSNYAHLKFTGKIGNVQYTSIWAYMLDPKNPRVDSLNSGGRYGDGIKWGAFQYLDYNVTNRLSIGFFQSVVWANRNEGGHRGFDFNYLNPVIFLRPVENSNTSSPDKMFLGLNAKYKVLDNATVYGQFLLGEFTAKEFFANNGYIHNKWGAQLGAKAFNIFGVKNLNVLGEYNMVRPYTYQHYVSISNYSNRGEPLAHPRGANFRELLGIANYSWKRFDFSLQGLYSRYGTDEATASGMVNWGGDIFQSYRSAPNMYGNKIGQGVQNDLYYADFKAAYVLNPKYNLRLELGYTQRYNRIEDQPTQKSGVINFGLRSSFRNFYGDM